LQPEASNRAVAKALGTSEMTVRRDTATNVAPPKKNGNDIKLDPDGGATFVAPTITGTSAAKLVQRREDRKARDAEAAAARPQITGEGIVECRHGDFRSTLVLVDPQLAADRGCGG
jgi:hypothetical protein